MFEFEGRSILSILDFSREEIEYVFEIANRIESQYRQKRRSRLCEEEVMAVLFFQPSTRTRLSFETAMQRLGGGVIGFASPEVSRAGDKFQESIADTARVIENYADVAVIRHYEDYVPAEFAKYTKIPVINAGNGHIEHPTQALLDIYTIKREKGQIDGIKVLLLGNMNWRTMHSFPFGLAKYRGVEIFIMSPEDKEMPEWVIEKFDDLGLNYRKVDSIKDVIEDIDVIYDETFGYRTEITEEKYRLSLEKLREAKEDLIILHPLPRTDELSPDLDGTPFAKYFVQSYYGLMIRMALLVLVLGKVNNLGNW